MVIGENGMLQNVVFRPTQRIDILKTLLRTVIQTAFSKFFFALFFGILFSNRPFGDHFLFCHVRKLDIISVVSDFDFSPHISLYAWFLPVGILFSRMVI